MQNPDYKLMHTGDSVSFTCHINISSGWEYLWYKDGTELAVFGISHNISSVVTTNTGSYTCKAKRGEKNVFHTDQTQAISLNVQGKFSLTSLQHFSVCMLGDECVYKSFNCVSAERPRAAVVLLTDWSEVFSTDSLVLKCVVQESQDAWNYTW